jgi:hypothetical protein
LVAVSVTLADPGAEQTKVVELAVGSWKVPEVAVHANVVLPASGSTSTRTETLAPTAATAGAMTSDEISRHWISTLMTTEPFGVVHCKVSVREAVWFAGTVAFPVATQVVTPSVARDVTVTEYSSPAGSAVKVVDVLVDEPATDIVFMIGAIPLPLTRKVRVESGTLAGNRTWTDRSPCGGCDPEPQLANPMADQATARTSKIRYD